MYGKGHATMADRISNPPTSSRGTSERYKDSTGDSWSNFSGSKDSHDVQADKLNSKNTDGVHAWYKPKSGEQGSTSSGYRQRDERK
jgi:hypothetical protein